MTQAGEKLLLALDEVLAVMDGRTVPAQIYYASAQVMTTPMLKRAWDEFMARDGDSVFGINCDELHAELNVRGEGSHCAV